MPKHLLLITITSCLVCVCVSHSVVSDSATPWAVARQAPLSMGFNRQEYWSGLPSPSPGDLPDPGIRPKAPASPALQAGSLVSEPPGKLPYCPEFNSVFKACALWKRSFMKPSCLYPCTREMPLLSSHHTHCWCQIIQLLLYTVLLFEFNTLCYNMLGYYLVASYRFIFFLLSSFLPHSDNLILLW